MLLIHTYDKYLPYGILLYRVKLIFVLGPNLTQLDSSKISANGREKARLRLEQGLSVNTGSNVNATLVQARTDEHPTSQTSRQLRETTCDETYVGQEHGAAEQLQCLVKNASEDKIRNLEDRVTSLSALIEK